MKNIYFVNNNGEVRLIGENLTEAAAMKTMCNFMQEHDFISPYTRIWKEENKTWYDVGSHTEFFYTEEIN